MRALVVVNPEATATTSRAHDVLLSALGHEVSLQTVRTTHRNHAAEVAATARAEGIELVVAFGGDGTVNEIVNGLLGDSGHAMPDIAVIPGGSTNVLARNLGIPNDPIEATGLLLDALRTGRRHPLSLGRVDDRFFTFAAGAGFNADVVRVVEQQRARGKRSSPALYARALVSRYFLQPDHSGGPITVRTDETEVDGIMAAVVSNCTPWTYLGQRAIRPSPRASFTAGLDVMALTSMRVMPFVRHLVQTMRDSDRGVHGADVLQLHDCSTITLYSAVPVPVEVDGDYLGERTEVEFRSVPSAVHVAF